MADKLSITGILVDREHKDGVTNDKHWDRYGFQIAGKDGKHWYSSFDTTSWEALRKGQCFEIYYSEKDNPSGGAPFRNVEWWVEVEMTPASISAAAEVVQRVSQEQDSRRSKEEMRLLDCLLVAATRLGGTTNGTRESVWTGGLIYYNWVTDWETKRRASLQDAPSAAMEAGEPRDGEEPVSSLTADGQQMIRDSARQYNEDVRAGVRPGREVTPRELRAWIAQEFHCILEELTAEQAIEVASDIANGKLGEPSPDLPF